MKNFDLKGKPFFFLGLLVFFLLASEFFVLFIDSLFTGKSLKELNLWRENRYFLVLHWLITILVWETGASLIFLWLKRKNVLQKIFSFSFKKRFLVPIFAAVVVAFFFSIVESIFSLQKGLQIVIEFSGFSKAHGEKALILSVFQNLYYLFESLLVVLLLAFFQLAGELWFKLREIPWGSLGLLLTWGFGHFLSHPQGALYIAIFSLIPGFIYLFSGKNFFTVFFFVFLSFIF